MVAVVYASLYAEPANGDVEQYARAAAALAGLSIEDDWWPSVLGFLSLLLAGAERVTSAQWP